MKEDSNLIAIQINFYPTANLGTEESGRYGEVGVWYDFCFFGGEGKLQHDCPKFMFPVA